MNIYKLSQTTNYGYNTFESCVVIAENKKEAVKVHPNIMRGSVGHLTNCVHVMKISAENALKRLKEVSDE